MKLLGAFHDTKYNFGKKILKAFSTGF